MGSLTMEIAALTAVPSGNALSVDREAFARQITAKILQNPHIFVHREDVKTIPDGISIIATGPLTSDELVKALEARMGEGTMSFYDASSPIVSKDSINFDIAYFKSRYDQGDDSYINCPMDEDAYLRFQSELAAAKIARLHSFETEYFEGCLPIEIIANRGLDTLRYGPLKPKGLALDRSHPPYAVVQLRQDNLIGDLYNIVGFQTNLTYSEQERVFRLIPGLERVEFVRYGLMHRNTYIKAPAVLDADLTLKAQKSVIIAGQLAGVEGYVESAATGIIAGIIAEAQARGLKPLLPPKTTMIGSLIHYICHADPNAFTPMNANFGILENANKRNREASIQKALADIEEYWRQVHE